MITIGKKMFSDVSGNDVVSISVTRNTIGLNENVQQQAMIFGYKALKLGCDSQNNEATVYSLSDLQQYLIDEDTDERQQLINTVTGWFSQGNRSVKVCDLGNVTADTINDLDQYCYIAISGYNWENIATQKNILLNTATQQLNTPDKACYIVGSLAFDQFNTNTKDKLVGYKSLFTIGNKSLSSNSQMAAGAVGYELSNYSPSSYNKVNPMTYRYLYSVLPLSDEDKRLNQQLINDYYTNFLVSPPRNTTNAKSLLFPGSLADGNDFTYWYGIDYIRFTLIDTITNLLISAANNSSNPLYYNQQGINRIKDAVNNVLANCAAYGIIENNYIVTTIDFPNYVTQNSGDYKAGIYGGITFEVQPLKAMKKIKFNMNVSDLIN
ncbi:unnamed protein product [Commensalibacter communis]|nr:unnamed protein product [Commensalibacter communis]